MRFSKSVSTTVLMDLASIRPSLVNSNTLGGKVWLLQEPPYTFDPEIHPSRCGCKIANNPEAEQRWLFAITPAGVTARKQARDPGASTTAHVPDCKALCGMKSTNVTYHSLTAMTANSRLALSCQSRWYDGLRGPESTHLGAWFKERVCEEARAVAQAYARTLVLLCRQIWEDHWAV